VKNFNGKIYLFENKQGKPYSRIYIFRKIKEETKRIIEFKAV